MVETLKPCSFCGELPQVRDQKAMHACRVLDKEIRTSVSAWNLRAERTCHPIHTRERWECDVCRCVIRPGFMPEFHGVGVLKYCPNCGARIKSDKE